MKKKLLINFASFQVFWFLCVQGNNLLALASLFIFMIIHEAWVITDKNERFHAIIFLTLGLLIESALNTIGIIDFSHSTSLNFFGYSIHLAPVWLLCLWLGFSTTFYHSLAWMENRKRLRAALVIFSLPLNYYAGAHFSGSTVMSPTWLSLLLVGFIWVGVFSLAFWLKRFLVGIEKNAYA